MAKHQRVVKSGPTLDKKPSGGLKFEASEATTAALNEIADQMKSPDMDGVDEQKEDRSKLLDPSFINMSAPPSVEIANVELREKIESVLSPIDIDSLFLRGELRQEVPIMGSKLTIEFRTLNGREDLFIKKRLTEVKSETIRYVEDRFMLMQLAAHIVAINGEQLPDMTENGAVVNELFDKRFDRIAALPVAVIERIWVHWVWFQDRVNKEMNTDFLTTG